MSNAQELRMPYIAPSQSLTGRIHVLSSSLEAKRRAELIGNPWCPGRPSVAELGMLRDRTRARSDIVCDS